MSVEQLTAKTVVVGSGAGGATVARELCLRGEDVLILELGEYHKPLGTLINAARMNDQRGDLRSIEGFLYGRTNTVGGCTVPYCATAVPPDAMFKDRYGIDLDPYVENIKEEHSLAPLPDHLIGTGARRIMESAREEGLNWNPFLKFINPDKCGKYSHWYYGCPNGSKWTARDYVEEAVAAGGRLRTRMTVEKVTSNNGCVTGVEGQGKSGPFRVEAERVVLAGNGMGSAVIMQKSGFPEAGKGVFMDPLITTFGAYDGPGSINDMPMGCGTLDLMDEGLFLADAWDPFAAMALGTITNEPSKIGRLFRYPRTLGILAKIKDGLEGEILGNGKMSKVITKDEQALLGRGTEIAKKILIRAGCDPKTIFVGPPRGSQPGGTVRIGELVDSNLKSDMKGLYVCDSSVLPEPDGIPPVLTIVALAKRLVAEQLAPEAQPA